MNTSSIANLAPHRGVYVSYEDIDLCEGNLPAAVFLSYLRIKSPSNYHFFHVPFKDIKRDLHMKRNPQERARERLWLLGLIVEEKRGFPAKLNFQLTSKAVNGVSQHAK